MICKSALQSQQCVDSKDSAKTDATNNFYTQFCNELAQVLGTHQCMAAKASVKTVTAASVQKPNLKRREQ